ncbi:MAG: SBBP repeat-containing protein [Ignavibacteria bacterium]|nr:SBBP repeat-containing protein [Ignavibacteria bacterium]
MFTFISYESFSQIYREWVRKYNGTANSFDIAASLKLNNLSDVYVFGSTSSLNSSTDAVIIKYSSSGTILWQSIFNGNANSTDDTKKGFIDMLGNSYLTGFTTDSGGVIKILTLKCAHDGNRLWSNVFLQANYNQGFGQDILTDNQLNVFVCGFMRRQNGSFDAVILKYSPSGALLANSVYNITSSSSEIPSSMCIDNSGNIYILGTTNGISGHNDIFILKYSNSLNLLSSVIFSGTAIADDKAVKITYDRTGNLTAVLSMNNSGRNLDYSIMRFTTSLGLFMQYHHNGSGNHQDIPYDLIMDTQNNIYVTGSSRNADTLGSEDIVTIKVDPTGQLLWSRFYNGSNRGTDYGTSLAVDNSGYIYVGGTTDEHEGHLLYALLKYSSTGDLLWLQTYSTQYRSEDFVSEIAVDNNYRIYVTGISFDSTSDYDITTIKYSQPIGLIKEDDLIPDKFVLYQNYPNPFNPLTKIRFNISVSDFIRLEIFDVKGSLVTTLIKGEFKSGCYEVVFDGKDSPSGIYFYRLSSEHYSETKKMLLVK